jgi:hypothetical protein
MVRNRLHVLLVAALVLVANSHLGGCAKSLGVADGVKFACESDPKPSRVGPNTFTVILIGENDERLAGARVSLEGDMSHAGMGPVFGDAKEIAPGRYQGMLNFNMIGDWTVLFHITLADGRRLERQVEIRNIQAT